MGKSKAKLHLSSTGQQLQTAVKPEIKQVAKDTKPANTSTSEPWCTVGSEVQVLKDYLDMKDLPEENGLSNCGYLILKQTDVVRILYVGSAQTDDPGWLYGEVIQCLSRAGIGRRGWLPATVVEPPPEPKFEAPPRTRVGVEDIPKVVTPTASVQSTRKQPVAPAIVRGSTLPKQKPASSVDPTSPPPSCTLAAAFAVANKKGNSSQRGGKAMQPSQRIQVSEEAFPALPGHSGRNQWEDECEEIVGRASSSQPEPPPMPARPRDVEGTIARHRAMAAAAAAKAQGNNANRKSGHGKSQSTCPICMEPFTAQRRMAQLPCCGVTLCSVCSEKSIKSSRCYFCRETAEEFPSLVASTGVTRG